MKCQNQAQKIGLISWLGSAPATHGVLTSFNCGWGRIGTENHDNYMLRK